MKNVQFFLSLLFVMGLSSQDKKIQKEIDDQVWYPFIKSYNSYDEAAYIKLHTKDILRVSKSGIKIGAEYFKKTKNYFVESKKRGDKQKISFVFESRYAKKNIAYEIGFYKVYSKRNGKKNYYYGMFHVVLKKIDGNWKVAQDWDTDKINGIAISESHFKGNVYQL